MSMLLFGKDGQVGFELRRALSSLGPMTMLSRRDADLCNSDAIAKLILEKKPSILVNAAAYTAVDDAENNLDSARRINYETVEAMAEACRAVGALFVHYSTDYVFDGTKVGEYIEDDITNPLNVYGHTKLWGENAIRSSGVNHFIFRTSWVYGRRGKNFAKTILRLASERTELRVVDDQIGKPTSAHLIADVTSICLYRYLRDEAKAKTGTYHLAAAGRTSWHGYAQLLISAAIQAGYDLSTQPENVFPISAESLKLAAKRPANSLLDTSKLESDFNLVLPDWRHHIFQFVEDSA